MHHSHTAHSLVYVEPSLHNPDNRRVVEDWQEECYFNKDAVAAARCGHFHELHEWLLTTAIYERQNNFGIANSPDALFMWGWLRQTTTNVQWVY